MRVVLKLFATYRRYLPPQCTGSACEVEVPTGTPVIDLLAQFHVPREPGASVILVNGRTAPPDRALQEDDVVAVFPAMAGG